MKKIISAAALGIMAFTMTPAAIAGDLEFGLNETACVDAVTYYLSERLDDPRSARIRLASDPYKVMVDLRSDNQTNAWAVDVLVKSRLPSGSWSNYQPYTVIFQDGNAVALESDLANVTEI